MYESQFRLGRFCSPALDLFTRNLWPILLQPSAVWFHRGNARPMEMSGSSLRQECRLVVCHVYVALVANMGHGMVLTIAAVNAGTPTVVCMGSGVRRIVRVANSTTAKLSSFTLASKVDDNIADPCRSEVTATLSAPRKRTPPGKAWCVPCAGTEAGRPARLCRACGEHGAWHGSSYCCCQCRDTDGRVHGLWCSQDCPGPGVANCTRAKVSPFTLAAQDPELLLLRPRARPLSRGTASQHIRCRDEVQREEASLEALFRHRFGWRDPEQGGGDPRVLTDATTVSMHEGVLVGTVLACSQ